MMEKFKSRKSLVLVGGGHANLLVLKGLAENPDSLLDITLVSDQRHAPNSGMMAGAIAGIYNRHEVFIDLVKLVQTMPGDDRMPCRFIEGKAEGIDLKSRKLLYTRRSAFGGHTEFTEISFDLLSIDTGSRPNLRDLPGAARFAAKVKPSGNFLDSVDRFFYEREPGNKNAVVQIGAGTAGCEVALALFQRSRSEKLKLDLTLIEACPRIMPSAPLRLAKKVEVLLKSFGARVLCSTSVQEIGDGFVVLSSGETLNAGFISVATNPRPGKWATGLPLKRTKGGFIAIDSKLQTSEPGIFAAGDVAENPLQPLPRAGVFAVRQAPVLLYNLKASARGRSLIPYQPQKNWLSLMIDGHGGGLGFRGNLVLPQSKVIFWLKNHLDRSFMKQFQ